jgi:hypothetical protein
MLTRLRKKQFNEKRAYEMVASSYSEMLADALKVSKVEVKEIVQSAVLLKKFFS